MSDAHFFGQVRQSCVLCDSSHILTTSLTFSVAYCGVCALNHLIENSGSPAKGMLRWRLMKADWVKEQNGTMELAWPRSLQGLTKDLQIEEITALPIPDTL